MYIKNPCSIPKNSFIIEYIINDFFRSALFILKFTKVFNNLKKNIFIANIWAYLMSLTFNRLFEIAYVDFEQVDWNGLC